MLKESLQSWGNAEIETAMSCNDVLHIYILEQHVDRPSQASFCATVDCLNSHFLFHAVRWPCLAKTAKKLAFSPVTYSMRRSTATALG